MCVCEGEREDGREADTERTGTQIVKDKEEKGRVIERKKDKQIKRGATGIQADTHRKKVGAKRDERQADHRTNRQRHPERK